MTYRKVDQLQHYTCETGRTEFAMHVSGKGNQHAGIEGEMPADAFGSRRRDSGKRERTAEVLGRLLHVRSAEASAGDVIDEALTCADLVKVVGKAAVHR